MRLVGAGNVKAKTKTAPLPTIDITIEEDAPVPVPGVLTSALRAGEALADVGAAVSRSAGRGGRNDGRRFPPWLLGLLALMGGVSADAIGDWFRFDAHATAAEVAELRGEWKAISGPEGRLVAVEKRAALTDARQHDSDWRGVEEYRVLSDDVGKIMAAMAIPPEERARLDPDIEIQHDEIRQDHRDRLRKAREQRLLEANEAAAERDSVAPP